MLLDCTLKVLENIAKKEGFTDYKIETKSGSNHGDNFLGIMTSVKVVGKRTVNGKTSQDSLYLLCKSPPNNEARRKNFQSGLVFAREAYIYSTVLPAFVKFQQEKGLSDAERFSAFPKVYACVSNEEEDDYLLIMQDLRPENYQMWPKDKTVPYDHAERIMKELGKFHAISFAMKDQRPNEFADFKTLKDPFCPLIMGGKLTQFMVQTIERTAKVLKNPEHMQMMLNFKNTYGNMLEETFAYNACDAFGVIGHGDCWNNNFLFKYKDSDTNHLQSVCFVDFQISRYCSPVLDLHYNLFSGTDKEFRDKNYEKLLKTYHSSLSETIRKLGSDPEKLYSYENFQKELKKFGYFALLTGPMIAQIRVAGAEDIRDLDDYSERVDRGETADLLNDFGEETAAVFSKLMNDLVTDLLKYEYIKLK